MSNTLSTILAVIQTICLLSLIFYFFYKVSPGNMEKQKDIITKKIESLGGKVLSITKLKSDIFKIGPFNAIDVGHHGRIVYVYKIEYIINNITKTIYVKFVGSSTKGVWKE
ncbi:hypothetical protein IZY60_14330 [Lutibacter sp. B2]|nr:hypothetical protein [Lutibacter sp. B2]